MTHRFTDRDGTVWTVEWRQAEAVARTVNGEPEYLPSGLEFTCSALVFRVPWPFDVHPRAIPRARLQEMVDRAADS